MAQSSRHRFTDRVAEAKAHEAALGGILARHTVALVPDTELKIGTGVLVSLRGDLFIATARHYVREVLRGDVYCLPKPPGPTKILEKDDVPGMLERGQVALGERFLVHLKERPILSTDGSDVALLHLVDRPAKLHEMQFYRLEDARSAPVPHPHVLVCGYPFDLTLVSEPAGRAAAFSRPVHGKLSTISNYPGYDPDRNLAISYENLEDPLAAAGMSGGGVWSPPTMPKPGAERPWDPRALALIGIQVGQFPLSRLLIATRIERVKALLS